MLPSEQANLPQWRGQPGFFEIWFIVVRELSGPGAWWLRYTTFAPADGGAPRCTVWAAAFDRDRPAPRFGKAVHPIGDYDAGPKDRFAVRIGDAAIEHGHCTGGVGIDVGGERIEWDLGFEVGDAPLRHTPALLEVLPLPTRVAHVADGAARGWISIGGVRHDLGAARAVQMHLWGTRRFEELAWLWAPSIGVDGELEVTAGRMRRTLAGIGAPRMIAVWMRRGDELDDRTQPPAALRAAVHSGPGTLDVRSVEGRRALLIRGAAPRAAFAGYVYRDTHGGDLHVAQCDVASAMVERFERARSIGGWRPVGCERIDGGAALELHAPEPIPGVSYVGWDGAHPTSGAIEAPAIPPPPSGELITMPTPRAIFAAGLTYKDHAKETGNRNAGPAIFDKALASWLPDGDVVTPPATSAILATLAALEPELDVTLRARYPYLPPLLDYEVELGMILLEDARANDLDNGRMPAVAWFVANDLTARTCQVLGEGQDDAMPYWSAAKSFAGFLPVGARAWVPPAPVDEPPAVELITRVGGVVRQRAPSSELVYKPSALLAAAARHARRDLAIGDVVLTGTPAGVAFQVSRLKRKIASLVLGRLGKLDAAFGMYVRGAGFLRPGDEVTVEAGFLGRRTIVVGWP